MCIVIGIRGYYYSLVVLQIECGAQVMQVFESWAHHLSEEQFIQFAKVNNCIYIARNITCYLLSLHNLFIYLRPIISHIPRGSHLL